MTIQQQKAEFEQKKDALVYESARLTFVGIDTFTVYNCSIPFLWKGKEYMYGRVEKRDQWARSWVRLFEKVGQDQYALVPDHTVYSLEDPYIAQIQGEFVLGGTHVVKKSGKIDTVYGYFYRGTDLNDLEYFTTGPRGMKDIRLVDRKDGTIGVFSRPRNAAVRERYGSESMIGFTTIRNLDELTDQVIENAAPIHGIFEEGEWGGCNQVYLLQGGKLGIIGHQSYTQPQTSQEDLAVYVNVAFEFDPETFAVSNRKVIGTRSCYPQAAPKLPQLADCTFTSGIVMRTDGRVDLYAGIGDEGEGRIVIDYPFTAPLA